MQAMYELEHSVQFSNLLNNCLSISSSIITWLGYRRGKHEVDFYIVFKKERIWRPLPQYVHVVFVAKWLKLAILCSIIGAKNYTTSCIYII